MILQGNNYKAFYIPSIGYNYKIQLGYLFGQIRKYVPFNFSLKTNLISRLKDPISLIYYSSEGTLNSLKEHGISEEKAKQVYSHSLATRNSAIRLYKKISSIQSYLDTETTFMLEKLVDNYYEIESILRKNAFQNAPLDKGDRELNEIASKISQQTIYSYS